MLSAFCLHLVFLCIKSTFTYSRNCNKKVSSNTGSQNLLGVKTVLSNFSHQHQFNTNIRVFVHMARIDTTNWPSWPPSLPPRHYSQASDDKTQQNRSIANSDKEIQAGGTNNWLHVVVRIQRCSPPVKLKYSKIRT